MNPNDRRTYISSACCIAIGRGYEERHGDCQGAPAQQCRCWCHKPAAAISTRFALIQFRTPHTLNRFWSKVNKTATCWVWVGGHSLGYGKFSLGSLTDGTRSTQQAHRVAYEWLVGPIPVGFTIDHLCRNRSCVNPAHMEPVTMKENSRRSESNAGKRSRVTECPRGHLYDEANTYVSPNGQRDCRICRSRRATESDKRRAEAKS